MKRPRIGVICLVVLSGALIWAFSAGTAFAALSSLAMSDPVTIAPDPVTPGTVNDNVLPGMPVTKTPWAGSLDWRNDPVDIYRIPLGRGDRIYLRVTRVASGTFRMRIFGPDTTSTAGYGQGRIYDTDTGRLEFLASKGGNHYIVIDTEDGAGAYRLWGDGYKDSFPGQWFSTVDVVNDTGYCRSAGDSVDIYTFRLDEGEHYTFSAARTSGSGNISLKVFPPDTAEVIGSPAIDSDTDSKVAYVSCEATVTDDYVVAVRYTSGAGTYRLAVPGSAYGLETHAYSFRNFGGAASQDVFKMTFGIPQPTALSPEALTYYHDVYKLRFGGGQCYGIAVTNALFYRGVFGPRPSVFRATYPWQIRRITTDYPLGHIDEPIEKHISKYHYYQYDPVIDGHATYWNKDFGSIAEGVDTAIGDGRYRDPQLLLFAHSDWGHAVDITGVNDGYDDKQGWFAIYDSNAPTSFRQFGIQSFADGPVMMTQDYGNLSPDIELWTIPASVHETPSIPPRWTEAGAGGVGCSTALPAGTQILHVDAQGRRLGSLGGPEYAEIPNAWRVRSFTGNITPGWTEPVQYYLPSRADYSVSFARPVRGWMRYDLFAGDVLARAQVTSAGPGVRSTLTTLRASRGFEFTTESTAPVTATLELHRQPGGASRVYTFGGLRVAASQTVTVTTPVNGAGAYLRATSPQRYTLQLKGFNGRTTLSTSVTASLTADATQSVVVWDWAQLRTDPVFVVESLPGGRESVTAFQAKGLTPARFASELAARRLIPSASLSSQVRSKLSLRAGALNTYLSGLVNQGRLSKRTAGMLYAYTLANRLPAGRVPVPATLQLQAAAGVR